MSVHTPGTNTQESWRRTTICSSLPGLLSETLCQNELETTFSKITHLVSQSHKASFSLLTSYGKCFIHSQGFSLERAHCSTTLGQPFSELHPLLAFSHIRVMPIHVKIAGFGTLSNFFLKLSIRLYGVFLFFWVNKFFPFFASFIYVSLLFLLRSAHSYRSSFRQILGMLTGRQRRNNSKSPLYLHLLHLIRHVV